MVAGSAASLRTVRSALDQGHGGFVQYGSTVAITGSSVSLSCTTDSDNTPFWDYYPYRRSHPITIYNGGTPSEELDARFVVDMEGCRASKCRLMIENVQLKDAGHFVCLQPDSKVRHLSLTVLGRCHKAVIF